MGILLTSDLHYAHLCGGSIYSFGQGLPGPHQADGAPPNPRRGVPLGSELLAESLAALEDIISTHKTFQLGKQGAWRNGDHHAMVAG